MPTTEDTGMPHHGPEQKKLLEACFDRRNRGIANIIHTSEKIQCRKVNGSERLDRLIDRVNLDRGLLIKEKMKVIMNGSEHKPNGTGQNFRSSSEEPIVGQVKRYHKLNPQQIIKEKKTERKSHNA